MTQWRKGTKTVMPDFRAMVSTDSGLTAQAFAGMTVIVPK